MTRRKGDSAELGKGVRHSTFGLKKQKPMGEGLLLTPMLEGAKGPKTLVSGDKEAASSVEQNQRLAGEDRGLVGDDYADEEASEDGSENEEHLLSDALTSADGRKKRDPIYNAEGLHDKLEDFGWIESADWLETLAVTREDAIAETVDVADDLAREVAFYSQAVGCAKVALVRLRELGVPVVRPKDYYAEMVKADTHMVKVQARLLSEEKEMEEKEERRKQREAKKYAKELQAEKQKERQRQKKEEIQAVEKWRKMRAAGGFGDEDTLPPGLEEGEGLDGSSKKGAKQSQGRADINGAARKGPSRKRKLKDAKFGFGGPKRLKKRNDAVSAGDMDGFRIGKGAGKSFPPSGVGRGARESKRGKANRPGKARRQNMRARGK